jgi:gluconolactonase
MMPVSPSVRLASSTLVYVAFWGLATAQSPPPAAGPRIDRLDARLDKLVPPDTRIEAVAKGFKWVEGPLWRQKNGDLLFTDIPKNAIMQWRPGATATIFLQPSGYTGKEPFTGEEPGANGLTLDSEGRLVMCEHGDRRVTRVESDGHKTVLADRFEGKRFNSPNDLVYGPDGALYFTDPPYGLPKRWDDPSKELAFQGVYRLASDGTLSLLARDIRAPNGIAFSPDGKTLYVTDTAESNPAWFAYDRQGDGRLGERRVFASAAEFAKKYAGAPDGLKVDREGNLFASGPGGVYVFAPDGTHLGTIILGARTSNTAWGEDGHTLFVTATDTVYRIRLATTGKLP